MHAWLTKCCTLLPLPCAWEIRLHSVHLGAVSIPHQKCCLYEGSITFKPPWTWGSKSRAISCWGLLHMTCRTSTKLPKQSLIWWTTYFLNYSIQAVFRHRGSKEILPQFQWPETSPSSPQKGQTLSTPWLWTCGLQNHDSKLSLLFELPGLRNLSEKTSKQL